MPDGDKAFAVTEVPEPVITIPPDDGAAMLTVGGGSGTTTTVTFVLFTLSPTLSVTWAVMVYVPRFPGSHVTEYGYLMAVDRTLLSTRNSIC